MIEVNWQSRLFWDFIYRLIILKKHDILEAGSVLFSGKELANLVHLLDQAILSHWVP
jgi:hypothetical protein